MIKVFGVAGGPRDPGWLVGGRLKQEESSGLTEKLVGPGFLTVDGASCGTLVA